MRHVRLPAALLCAMSLLVGLWGTAPAGAAEAATLEILSPTAGSTLSGSVTVSFRVTVAAGSPSSSYRVHLGRRAVLKNAFCSSTCQYTATIDTATSPFPDYRSPSSVGQVDDGPQQVTVEARDSSSILLGRTSVGVLVDNDRPTLELRGPAVPSGVTDGRRTADRSLRVEAFPQATAAGASIARVVASGTSDGEALEVTPPAQPGEPWVVTADPSGWAVGPRNIDIAAFDSLGRRSAMAPFDVMVVHGFSLWGPTIESPVWDDDVTPLELDYQYPQYVTGSWPVRVETLVDGAAFSRQDVTDSDRAQHPGALLVRPGLVPPGQHTLSFVVTDNRGLSQGVDRSVEVRASGAVSWVSGQGQRVAAGRRMTFTATASTETGYISSWILEDAATGDLLDIHVCSDQCPANLTQALSFVPRTAGPLDLRLRVGFGPGPRSERTAATTATVLPAPTDFSGDGAPDVLARDSGGRLYLYRGSGHGGWSGSRAVIGTGWQGFTAIVSNGDHNGDLRPDVMARGYADQLYFYAGNGAGGWSGRGEPMNDLVLPRHTVVSGLGDFDGDALADLISRDTAGRLYLYRGSTSYRTRTQIGSGWQGFTSLFSPGDFDGDGHPDVMARASDGRLLLYRGNGRGGWAAPGRVVGTGWGGFTALTGIGDFDGDGRRDVLARRSDGRLLLYRGNGRGGWAAPGYAVGTGWQGFTAVVGVG